MGAVPGNREGRRHLCGARTEPDPRKVAATRAAREANIAKRRDVLTGASEFPNLHEAESRCSTSTPVVLPPLASEVQVRSLAADAAGRAVRGAARCIRTKSSRGIRRAAKDLSRQSRHGPADFTARATFAKSFFETGGIEAIDTRRLPTRQRWPPPSRRPARHRLPVLPSDKVYAEHAAAAAKALQAAGATHIYLAGRPGEQEAALRAAGVSDFILPAATRWRRCRKPGGGWSEHDGTNHKTGPDRRLPARAIRAVSVPPSKDRASAIAGCARRHRRAVLRPWPISSTNISPGPAASRRRSNPPPSPSAISARPAARP